MPGYQSVDDFLASLKPPQDNMSSSHEDSQPAVKQNWILHSFENLDASDPLSPFVDALRQIARSQYELVMRFNDYHAELSRVSSELVGITSSGSTKQAEAGVYFSTDTTIKTLQASFKLTKGMLDAQAAEMKKATEQLTELTKKVDAIDERVKDAGQIEEDEIDIKQELRSLREYIDEQIATVSRTHKAALITVQEAVERRDSFDREHTRTNIQVMVTLDILQDKVDALWKLLEHAEDMPNSPIAGVHKWKVALKDTETTMHYLRSKLEVVAMRDDSDTLDTVARSINDLKHQAMQYRDAGPLRNARDHTQTRQQRRGADIILRFADTVKNKFQVLSSSRKDLKAISGDRKRLQPATEHRMHPQPVKSRASSEMSPQGDDDRENGRSTHDLDQMSLARRPEQHETKGYGHDIYRPDDGPYRAAEKLRRTLRHRGSRSYRGRDGREGYGVRKSGA